MNMAEGKCKVSSSADLRFTWYRSQFMRENFLCQVIFLETICNDQAVIDKNVALKIQQSPDYADQ